MSKKRYYDKAYKIEAVKLAKEIGGAAAARELGVPANSIYAWVRASKMGSLDLGIGTKSPSEALSLNEELAKLRQENKMQAKEIKRLKEMNEFLEEASAFFAASRQRSGK